MPFLRNHCEKLLLSLVLVTLLGAVSCLPLVVAAEQQRLAARTTVPAPAPKPLPEVDLHPAQLALKRATSPARLDLGAPNRLFNPQAWQQTLAPHRQLVLKAKAKPPRPAADLKPSSVPPWN